jgi:beta-mannosidase
VRSMPRSAETAAVTAPGLEDSAADDGFDWGWSAAASPPGAAATPAEAAGLEWTEARVPGTAAGALRAAGALDPFSTRDLDAEDWWFRTGFEAGQAAEGETAILRLGGIATVAEVFLNGELILESDSMFAAHAVDVTGRLEPENELAICCRALGPLLAERRKPRARWRTRLVKSGNLRFFRTMLLGRAPGFAPGPAPVGPWRPVWLERRRGPVIESLRLNPRLEDADGVLDVSADVGTVDSVEVELSGPSGEVRAQLEVADGEASGELRVPNVATWWPHTHGEPALHDLRLSAYVGSERVATASRRVGFRSISPGPRDGHDVLADGLDLHVNGVRVFARGAVWTPLDIVGMAPEKDELRAALEQARDAGMNMLRVPGIAAYESADFHDLCDELGILVWQDFMFANMDYPIADDGFRAAVEAEAARVLDELAGRPSVAVLCGGSEVEQQAAMLGLEPEIARGDLFGELLPGAVESAGCDAVYVASAPSGGDLPFRPNAGIANYYGVGAYLRPLSDARLADVRFAAECLAFANVPGEEAIAAATGEGPATAIQNPRWKAAVPRDAGAGWDFEDVRDHYLQTVFGIDPVELRSVDTERYLQLSAAVTGEVMAGVFGEWRRRASRCGGGLVLSLNDLAPGAGWGVVDSLGHPKVALHHLRRALAPVAVWMTDEGLGGLAVHVANDRDTPLRTNLRVALYRDREQPVDEACERLEVAPRSTIERNAETVLGRFADVSFAYRFGPPAQDVVVASLEDDDGLRSQAFAFPAGRFSPPQPASALGLEASVTANPDGTAALRVSSRRHADGVLVDAPGFVAADDAFGVEPGHERVIALRPADAGAELKEASLTALNLTGRVKATIPEER